MLIACTNKRKIMDGLLVFFGLISIFVFIGGILGWVAFFRTRSLAAKNDQLKEEINCLNNICIIIQFKRLDQHKGFFSYAI